jgi:hypothetical protein
MLMMPGFEFDALGWNKAACSTSRPLAMLPPVIKKIIVRKKLLLVVFAS